MQIDFTFRMLIVFCISYCGSCPTQASEDPAVKVKSVPNQGIQPQVATDSKGNLHLVYFTGEPKSGDIQYCRLRSGDSQDWTEPVRVNSQPKSAVAIGSIRGAQIAIGTDDLVHVAWNGSSVAAPKGVANPTLAIDSPHRFSAPMLYARIEPDGKKFEEQRNLMTHTYALDGGGAVAADMHGNVYVVWHANSINQDGTGEESRTVWITHSEDSGETFSAEYNASDLALGACGCCGLRAFCEPNGTLRVLFRAATKGVDRDMYLLSGLPSKRQFSTQLLSRWSAVTCMMSSAGFGGSEGKEIAVWESEKSIYFAQLNRMIPASKGWRRWNSLQGKSPHKHPCVAMNDRGQFIIAWSAGTGWNKGGEIAWQVFDESGNPMRGINGTAKNLAAWTFPAVYANTDGSFQILY